MKYCSKCQRSYSNSQSFCTEDGASLAYKDLYGLMGRVIADKYKVESLVGLGGMSAVYSAHQVGVERRVALKMLLPHLAVGNTQTANFFAREAQAAGQLMHENIATVFDAGRTSDGLAYIAMEFLSGQTLEEELKKSGPLSLERTHFFLQQIAAALDAAHAKNIIHRDLKPGNIMLIRRADGQEQLKVLDFGLAKLASGVGDLLVSTAVGTPHYASPEQFQLGEEIDQRTDIYSLGVILYQMLTGRLPFQAQSLHEVIRLHMLEDPEPVWRFRPDVPEALDNLIQRMLAKSPQRRPQRAGEVAFLFERALELPVNNGGGDFAPNHAQSAEDEFPSSLPSFSSSSLGPARGFATAASPATSLPSLPLPEPVSAPEGIQSAMAPATNEEAADNSVTDLREIIKPTFFQKLNNTRIVCWASGHRLAATGLLVIVVMLATVPVVFFANKPKLAEKDSVLLAEFTNTTNEEIFDSALRQALFAQLVQSPFLNILPDFQIRETLRFMKRSPDERLTPEIAREICLRKGLKVWLTGRINKFNNGYSVTLQAFNSQTEAPIANTVAETKTKEGILQALEKAATEMRQQLGESIASIQKFNTPVRYTTTASLEALKAYSLGIEESNKKSNSDEALALYKRATDLDPEFVLAYIALAAIYANQGKSELSAAMAEKAYKLRGRVSEHEQLTTALFYYLSVSGEIEKAAESLKLLTERYPNSLSRRINLSTCYGRLGQYQSALVEAEEALRVEAGNVRAIFNRAELLIRLNRFDEAKAALTQAIAQKRDSTSHHALLYQIAFVQGDPPSQQQQIQWMTGKPDEYKALDWQTQTAAFTGKLREANTFADRAIEINKQRKLFDTTAELAIAQALRQTLVGEQQKAKAYLQQALALDSASFTRFSLKADAPFGLLALTLSGDFKKAKALNDDLAKRYPKNTLTNFVWLPLSYAALELEQGQPEMAAKLLQATNKYEAGAAFWPPWLRGQAYLKLGKGKEAALEFRKILDNRGYDPTSLLYPLAQLGLARALLHLGDTAQSRKHYEDFFSSWKDADRNLPVLLQAEREYAKLK